MGLFSWLFKKKKEEPKLEQRHFIDDVTNDKKSPAINTKSKAEINAVPATNQEADGAKTTESTPPTPKEAKKASPSKPAATAKKPADTAHPAPTKKATEAKKPEAEKPVIKNDTPVDSAPDTSEKSEAEADKISEDKNAETVKVKGYGGAFDIKKSKDGRYVFNLYAANHVIVATSQIYSSSQSAMIGIKSIIANAERANVEDQTLKQYQSQPFPKWEIYVDKGGQFRWRLLATNGSCILHSQGYTQKSTCKKGIESVIRTAKSAKIDKSYLEKN